MREYHVRLCKRGWGRDSSGLLTKISVADVLSPLRSNIEQSWH